MGHQTQHFREGGAPHQLLVLTDLSQTPREEERNCLAKTFARAVTN